MGWYRHRPYRNSLQLELLPGLHLILKKYCSKHAISALYIGWYGHGAYTNSVQLELLPGLDLVLMSTDTLIWYIIPLKRVSTVRRVQYGLRLIFWAIRPLVTYKLSTSARGWYEPLAHINPSPVVENPYWAPLMRFNRNGQIATICVLILLSSIFFSLFLGPVPS